MAKTYLDHRDINWPGTWLVQNELPAAIPEIPYNRTLYIQQLTDEAPDDVEFVNDCQTMAQIFERYQPGKLLELTNEDGVGEDVNLQFRSMKDFGREGIIEQSETLSRISSKQLLYEGFMEKLTDDQLNMLLSDPEDKAAYLAVIDSLIAELDGANAG